MKQVMGKEPLITKYRPQTLGEIYGNELAIRSLDSALTSDSCPHCFLFTGNSGIGKSTLSKIVADRLNANITVLDAASNSSVDDTRRLVETSKHQPIFVKPNICYVIEEAHNLSQKGFEPLLLLTENPPPYLYVIFCSTEPKKIPKTIETRAFHLALKPLKPQEISELITTVAELEAWTITPEVMTAMIQASEGSARQALTILQVGHEVTTAQQLSEIVQAVESENNPAIQLCQFLMKGGENWRQISRLLAEIEGNEEEVLILCCRYVSKAIIKSEETQAHQFARLLHALTKFSTFDSRVNLIAGITWYLFGNVIF